MAIVIKVKLGGPTSYFGKIKQKPFFGFDEDKEEIEKDDVKEALSIKPKLDLFIVLTLATFAIIQFL